MAGVTDKTDFRLLRFFTTTSLLAFLIVAALLGYVFRALSIDGLLKGYENEHGNLAKIIANEMWEQDFGPLVRAMEGKSAAEIKVAPQLPELHQKVQILLWGTKTFKIKVYNLKGMTIYSTDLRQIGEDKSNNAGVMAGLQGQSRSSLTHRNQFSTFEGEVQNHDLVESYVPRYDPATGKVSGVFEIYGDATSVLMEIGRKQWIIVGSVIGMLSLLYLALFIIVKRAQDLISRQNQEREHSQQALSESEERWEFALEGSGDGVWDRNLQTGEVVYSKRYKEMYGFAENELENHQESWDERVHPDDLPLVEAGRDAYFAGQKSIYANERRMQCKDGSWKWVLSRGMVVARDGQGKPLRMIGTHSDITERKAAEEHMQHLAHFDLLTGLANRTLFTDRLQQTIAKARRDKARLALMFIDLDEFKPVNDTLGHHIGDLLLKEVASRLQECLRRETDTVGRMGGDEFVVILPEIEASSDALNVAEKILHTLNQSFDIAGHTIHISASIGIALFPEHGSDEKLLLKSADAAMYLAKEGGRNRLVVAEG